MPLELVAWEHPDALRLRLAQQAELRERYGEDDLGHDMPGDDIAAMVVLYDDAGGALACGALRAGGDLEPGTGELKRLFVAPAHRGRGHARTVLLDLEARAERLGLTRLILETGPRQPEAIGLYLSAGYAPTDAYGEYVGLVDSRCFAKDLRPVPGLRRRSSDRAVVSVEIERVRWDDDDAARLRRRMYTQFNAPTYPDLREAVEAAGGFEVDDAAQGVGELATWVARIDGRAVGCLSLRAPRDGHPAGSAELKKLYVEADARGAGVSKRLLDAAEAHARELGYERLVLQTGMRQPEAVGLYTVTGWRPIVPFPPYDDDVRSLVFGKELVGR
ncbi:GNAT family N-acetyltransferase [Cellulomonas sp. HZM]|uniref:GNAT family N-acetyltransferase n=1 Tax=Cellulomonas sp. HZM TaxID=1454010 RepID=UPI0004930F7D|nr:GNAT family N-acetyltransferase [Cellulomonas sp. HZM]